jgi:cyclopropane fatty-acyl-phospholipid synthase-like methyltransferase
MVEAVGHENLPAYFGAISSLLKPGGQAVIQVSLSSSPNMPPHKN